MKKHKLQKVINIKNLNEELKAIRKEPKIFLEGLGFVTQDLYDRLIKPEYFAYSYPETAIIEFAHVRPIQFLDIVPVIRNDL